MYEYCHNDSYTIMMSVKISLILLGYYKDQRNAAGIILQYTTICHNGFSLLLAKCEEIKYILLKKKTNSLHC